MNVKNVVLMSAAGAILLTPITNAYATKKVSSPYVKKGQWELEHKGSYTFDDSIAKDGEYKSKTALGYGITDFWALEIGAELKDPTAGESMEFRAWEIESLFQIGEKGQYPVDMGVKISYEDFKDSSIPEEIGLKFMLSKDFEQWRHRANLKFNREIGDGADNDLAFELSWQTAAKITPDFKVAVEYYGDFGSIEHRTAYENQDHRLGPVLKYEIPGTHVELAAGVLMGVSESAPDATLKWELEWKF